MTPMERIEGELSDAQKRIAELERRNVGLAKECQAQQEQITELKNALTRQARAAKTGMDAAKKHGSHMESEAKRLHAECNPEALESEREANAKLTELVAELERERDAYRAAEEMQVALRQKIEQERDSLAALFVRLQDGTTDLIHASSEEEAGDAMELIAECCEKEARSILARAIAESRIEGALAVRHLTQGDDWEDTELRAVIDDYVAGLRRQAEAPQ